jgi:hypothetical protein
MTGEGRAAVVAEVARKKAELRKIYVEYKQYFMLDQDHWPLIEQGIIALSNYYDGEDQKSKRDLSMYMLGHDIPADRSYCVWGEELKHGLLQAADALYHAIRKWDEEIENRASGVHKGIFAEVYLLSAELGILLARESVIFHKESIERETNARSI